MDLISGIGDQIYEARADIKLIHSNMDKEENRQIISWLSGTDYESIHADYRKRKMSGTGGWITNSTEFLEWLQGDKQTLFCSGRPGAGKTIITTTVIDWLEEKMLHKDTGDIGIAHIYFNYKRHGEETAEAVIANLLGQLSRRLSSMPGSVRNLYEQDAKGKKPKIEQYLEALSSVAAFYAKVFILIDALDECHPGERRQFLTEIFNFQTKGGANLFVTSRDIPDINAHFKESLKIEISGKEEDLRKYMEGSLPDLPRILSQKPELWEQIQRKTLKAADGIFLLVTLRFEYLRNLVTENEILEVLKKDPGTGSDSVYHEAYNQIMTRIQGQHKHSFSRARSLLSWLTGSKRQLTTQELRHALAVQVGRSQFDKKDIPDLGRLVSFCYGLVAFDEDSDIVRLVHYTAQDYLMENQSEWLPNMETEIAESCVTYLSYNIFGTGACDTRDAFDGRLRSNPLYEYASANWGYHVNAAAIGGAEIETKDKYGRTPLLWATENGDKTMVELLLAAKAEIETKNSEGLTALSLATRGGYKAIVQLLLQAGAAGTVAVAATAEATGERNSKVN
ncbi:hypothetical protein TWF106_011539 [Orbilia oligospora]|uniref:Uncharacterized protein n=1 Tax=Orbilia oligospora TaxID=2813651 RepID=A0A7C8UFZ8_ORBOL|nr:hypothetical protein TWF106_011539 [Orbilia oligospora]